jgi:hypothetical protein
MMGLCSSKYVSFCSFQKAAGVEHPKQTNTSSVIRQSDSGRREMLQATNVQRISIGDHIIRHLFLYRSVSIAFIFIIRLQATILPAGRLYTLTFS